MVRLKSRTVSPPGGFLYHQKETAWRNWVVEPSTQWDFNLLCTALQAHRRANPQFRLQTNLGVIQNEVDIANAMRVAAMPNAESYIINDAAPVPFQLAPAQISRLQQVAAAVKSVSVGAKTISDFWDSGESPVSQELAESRAATCAECPQNGRGDFTRWFTIPASEAIRKQLEKRDKRGLRTASDNQLGVCLACLCPLKLKVWFPISFIAAHMDGDTKDALQPDHPRCWALKEMDALCEK